MNKKTLWITQTAIMLALLIVVQVATKSLGQIVTGSCVNFVLAMTAFAIGLSSGLVVAIVSPFIAFTLGIGPAFFTMVPGVACGNAVFVLVIALLYSKAFPKDKKWAPFASAWIAALAKFVTLYIVVVKLIVPSLGAPDAAKAKMSVMFSTPQLATALIGGTIAALAAPAVIKAIKKE